MYQSACSFILNEVRNQSLTSCWCIMHCTTTAEKAKLTETIWLWAQLHCIKCRMLSGWIDNWMNEQLFRSKHTHHLCESIKDSQLWVNMKLHSDIRRCSSNHCVLTVKSTCLATFPTMLTHLLLVRLLGSYIRVCIKGRHPNTWNPTRWWFKNRSEKTHTGSSCPRFYIQQRV